MIPQIIILAAGKGTRMASPIPKVLIPLNKKPVIEHLLKTVSQVTHQHPPIIVVGFESARVKKALGPNYTYANQEIQNGTGHAVLAAQGSVTSQSILVLYGDMPFVSSGSLEKLIALHGASQSKVSMFTSLIPNFKGEYKDFMGFGRIVKNNAGEIVKIREYVDCTEQEKQIREVNPGIYMFDAAWLWPHLEQIGHGNKQDEFYLTDIIEIAIADGEKIATIHINPQEIYGINTPEHLLHAQTLIQNK